MKYDLLTTLNLPHRNVFFTGRETILSTIDKELHKEVSQPVALCGSGGMGKTQLVIEYAHRYAENYFAILWVNAASQETYHTDMLTIADLLNLAERHEHEQDVAINAVKNWLQTHADWLFILDNLENELLLPSFLPQSSTGHVLLTTQLQKLQSSITLVEVDAMTEEEGTSFLLRRARILDTDSSSHDYARAKDIVQQMGGLPLALDQAGAFIEETCCGLDEYLKLYQSQSQALLKRRGGLYAHLSQLTTSYLAFAHPESVQTTWSLSIEKIVHIHPLTRSVLSVCAFLYPDDLPEDALLYGVAAFHQALHVDSLTQSQLQQAITVLCTYSMLRYDDHKRTLSIHRLLQIVLRDEMNQDTQHIWAECAVNLISDAFPSVEFRNWDLCKLYLPQALQCKQLIEHDELHIESDKAAHLLHELGFYLFERARYDAVEAIYQQALEMQKKVLGAKHPHVARSLYSMALLYREQGRYSDAKEQLTQAYDIRKQKLHAPHLDLSATLYQLGRLHTLQATYNEAEEVLLRALEMQRRLQGSSSAEISASLNELGWLYRYKGEYEKAEELLTQALTMRKSIFPPDDPHIALTLINLAWVYYDMAEYVRAESLLQQAKDIQEQALGSTHPRLARTLNSLGLLYCFESRYEESEPLHLQAQQIRQRALGEHHPDFAQTLDDLGLLYYHQKRYAEAEPLYQRALHIREKALRHDHPDITRTLTNLARLYLEQGQFERAESLFKEALAIREKALGPMHPNVANCLNGLALLYVRQNKMDEAEGYYQRVLSIREAKLKNGHPRLIQTLLDIANVHITQGRYEQAEQEFLRVLEMYNEKSIHTHKLILKAYDDYIALCHMLKNEERAVELEQLVKLLRTISN